MAFLCLSFVISTVTIRLAPASWRCQGMDGAHERKAFETVPAHSRVCQTSAVCVSTVTPPLHSCQEPLRPHGSWSSPDVPLYPPIHPEARGSADHLDLRAQCLNFPGAAVTNYHRSGGLKQHKCLPSEEARSPKSRCSQGCVPSEGPREASSIASSSGPGCSLAWGCVTPVSAFVCTGPSPPLSVSSLVPPFSPSYKDGCHLIYLCILPCQGTCRILVPWLGIKPEPPAVKMWSLDYWTSREVLCHWI